MMETYKVHLHLHSSHEAAASMAAHAEMAQRLGLDALFITDHDSRMGYMRGRVNEFAFETPELMRTACGDEVVATRVMGWKPLSGEVRAAEPPLPLPKRQYAMEMTAEPGGGCAAVFECTRKLQQVSLLSQVNLHLQLYLPVFDPKLHGVCVRILLSQRPGDHQRRSLCYTAGLLPEPFPEAAVRLPLSPEPGAWRDLELDLTGDARKTDPFGADNCFCTVEISIQNRGDVPFRLLHGGMSVTRLYAAEEVRRIQQAEADRIGAAYGVNIFVANEISSAGQHKNSFSSRVPVLDYRALDYRADTDTALEHLKKWKGVYSYNHMFNSIANNEAADPAARTQELIGKLLLNRCEGAQILEVGFPEGRHGASLEQHTRVWDALSCAGLFLTGVGVSDSHDCNGGWLEGNNFAAYILAEACTEEALTDSLLRGSVYSADPVRWNGDFSLEADGCPMGSAFTCIKQSEHTARIRLRFSARPLRLKVRSGETVLYESELQPGRHGISVPFTAVGAVEPVRAELFDEQGRCCLLSNPVYAVTDQGVGIPEMRRYQP